MSKPQLGGPVIRTFQFPPPGVPHVWNDASEPQQRKVELWVRKGREFCRKWRLPRHFWVLLRVVLTTRDRWLYFHSEGRRAVDFFARKIRRLRPGLNPRTWVQEASTLTSRPPKPLIYRYCMGNRNNIWNLRRQKMFFWSLYKIIEQKKKINAFPAKIPTNIIITKWIFATNLVCRLLYK